MRNELVLLKIQQRLNKLATMDFDNIEAWQIAEAFNKAQLAWIRAQTLGLNTRQQSEESTTGLIDDLEQLLKRVKLQQAGGLLIQEDEYFRRMATSYEQPADYVHFKAVQAIAKQDCCPDLPLIVTLTGTGTEARLLTDPLFKPSIQWGETFCTINNKLINLFHGGEFEFTSVVLIYYRSPRPISFAGYVDPATGAAATNTTCELRDDQIEIIIDETAAILASDIENILQAGAAQSRAAKQG